MAARISYQDFDLHLERGSDGFRATCARIARWRCVCRVCAAVFAGSTRELHAAAGAGATRGAAPETPRNARPPASSAASCSRRCSPASCARACAAASTRCRDCGQGLRIRLHVKRPRARPACPGSISITPTRNQFLALSIHTPLVRYLELPEPIPALTIDPPLNVLVMVSSPTDYPSLDVEREWRILNDAVGTLHPTRRVVCDRLDEADAAGAAAAAAAPPDITCSTSSGTAATTASRTRACCCSRTRTAGPPREQPACSACCCTTIVRSGWRCSTPARARGRRWSIRSPAARRRWCSRACPP